MQLMPAPPMLRAAGLTMTYAGGSTTLAGLTVDVPPGSVGLVGANGAGKTTFFRLVLGLMRRRGLGRRLGRSRWRPIRSACAAHSATCPSTTASRSTRPPPTSSPRSASSPASHARRAPAARPTYSTWSGSTRPVPTGRRLLHRHAGRTKLAQALVADPALVLLDEPTAGLDPVGPLAMLDLVGRLAALRHLGVLATHLLDDVQRVCDHVVMLDRGHLVLAGPIDQLMQTTPA